MSGDSQSTHWSYSFSQPSKWTRSNRPTTRLTVPTQINLQNTWQKENTEQVQSILNDNQGRLFTRENNLSVCENMRDAKESKARQTDWNDHMMLYFKGILKYAYLLSQ